MIALSPYRHGSAVRRPMPGQILRGMTGRDYLSPSQVSTFQSCGLKWWFTYVANAQPESTSASMAFGFAIHAAIEKQLQATIALQPPPSIEALLNAFDNAFDQETSVAPVQFAKGESRESLHDLAGRVLQSYLESPLATPRGQIIGVEQTLRIKLAADLPELLGRIDLMTLHEGILQVTDFKTTKASWSDETAESNAQQLALYAQAAEPLARELGAKIRLQFVLLTKHKVPRVEAIEVSADPEKIQRSALILRQVFNAMTAGHIYPSPSQINCCTCPFQRRCKTWHLNRQDRP